MGIEHCCYGYHNKGASCAHEYLLPTLLKRIAEISVGKPIKIIDIGCGNGYVASKLTQQGHSVVGIDVSPDGIEIARTSVPKGSFFVCSIYDEALSTKVDGQADCVVSLEVVEHLLYPKKLFEQSYEVLIRGGSLIVSTPYHGYLKNLALSLTNGWDRHFSVDWDGGHIKFFSKKTLARMAYDAGFANPRFYGVGRVPGVWKSMIMIFQKTK